MYRGSLSNKKYHLLWSIVLGVAVMLLLSGCNPDRNKPYNFLNSVWVCEEAHACIAVTERESQAYSYGKSNAMEKLFRSRGFTLTGSRAHFLISVKRILMKRFLHPKSRPINTYGEVISIMAGKSLRWKKHLTAEENIPSFPMKTCR